MWKLASHVHKRAVSRHGSTPASLGRRDPYGAFEWYLAAAKQGSATGQFLVGLAYTNGVA